MIIHKYMSQKTNNKLKGALLGLVLSLNVMSLYETQELKLSHKEVLNTLNQCIELKACVDVKAKPVVEAKIPAKMPQNAQGKEQSEIITIGHYKIKREVLEQVVATFGKNETITAIIFAESGFDTTKTNYNCYYKVDPAGTYVKALGYALDFNSVSKEKLSGYVGWTCKKSHNKYAFSKDSGLLMINSINGFKQGDLKYNLSIAKNLLDKRGYNQWSAYNLGLHTQYKDEAKTLLSKI